MMRVTYPLSMTRAATSSVEAQECQQHFTKRLDDCSSGLLRQGRSGRFAYPPLLLITSNGEICEITVGWSECCKPFGGIPYVERYDILVYWIDWDGLESGDESWSCVLRDRRRREVVRRRSMSRMNVGHALC